MVSHVTKTTTCVKPNEVGNSGKSRLLAFSGMKNRPEIEWPFWDILGKKYFVCTFTFVQLY